MGTLGGWLLGYSGLLVCTVQYALLGFGKENDGIIIPAVGRESIRSADIKKRTYGGELKYGCVSAYWGVEGYGVIWVEFL